DRLHRRRNALRRLEVHLFLDGRIVAVIAAVGARRLLIVDDRRRLRLRAIVVNVRRRLLLLHHSRRGLRHHWRGVCRHRDRRSLRRGATGRLRLPVARFLVGGHRHLATTLHPTLYRALLGLEPIRSARDGHLLGSARARIVVAAIRVGGHRFVVIARPVGG